MSKINKIVTSEVEGQGTQSGDIPPLGMHFDDTGAVYFADGVAESAKFIAQGEIYGANLDSSDGLANTLKLIPDETIVTNASEQYLIVEPQSTDRIHIRAGGTNDDSSAVLALGGSSNHIRINDSNNSVTISTKNTDITNELVFTSQGVLTTTGSLNFESLFPTGFEANLNANSYVGDSSSFTGNGWVYTISFNLDNDIVTIAHNSPILTSNIGYSVGDVFTFGPTSHGIPNYTLEVTILDITDNSSSFSANLSFNPAPVIGSTITSSKSLIFGIGGSVSKLNTDGTLELANNSKIGGGQRDSAPTIELSPTNDITAKLTVYAANQSGNVVYLASQDAAGAAIALGDSAQNVKILTDGNINITATNADRTESVTWGFLNDGRLSAASGSVYLKQSVNNDNIQGLFAAETQSITVASGADLTLKANATQYSLTENSEFNFPNSAQLNAVTFQNTYTGLRVNPDSANAASVGLTVYTTGSSGAVYVSPNDDSDVDLVFGTVMQHVNLKKDGNTELRSRTGSIADPGVTASSHGGNLLLRAGNGGNSLGDSDYGSQGGHVIIQSGLSTKNALRGGDITLRSGGGISGFGNINLEIDDNKWTFTTSNIVFPDGSLLSTASSDRIKSNTAQLIINGLGPEPYVLFPAASTGGQLQISEAELSSIAGNLALTSAKDTFIISNGDGSVPGGSKLWKADRTGNLILPQTDMMASPTPVSLPGITFSDGTFQTTAYTGAAATVDITNTNGLTTTYYPTFVESRTNGQYVRADVDLTYRTDDNLLRAGNIQVGRNIYGTNLGGISDAIQLRPNIDIDKRFLFTVDSGGGNYIRSGMEMPMAEVDKTVNLAFPHVNSTSGYIFNQGNDTNGTEWNNALVIFQNGGNVKIGTVTGSGSKVWQFGSDGKFTIPGNTMLAGVQEKFNSFSSVSGVVSLDASVVQVFYITSPEANFTPNLIGLSLSSGHATAVTFVISQGATAYYPSALQINGVAQTINWQGNQTPTPTANRVDSVAFSILNNSGTYIVLGQMTGF